jgi:hypothetical protein
MKSSKITRLALGLLIGAGTFFLWQELKTNRSAVPGSERARAFQPAPPVNELPMASTQRDERLAPSAAPERIQISSDPDRVPLWTVKYGAEFWRRTTTEPTAEPATTSATALVNPPFNLGDVIERVDHGLTADPATGLPRLDAAT